MTDFMLMSNVWVSVVNNVTYRSHIHRRLEIVVVMDGVLRMQIGKSIFDISKGCAVFAEEYEPHSFISGEDNTCCIIEFPPEANTPFSTFLKENSAEDRRIKLSNTTYNFIINRLLAKRLNLCLKSKVTLNAVVALLCDEFAQKCSFKPEDKENDDVLFSALRVITEELKKTISLVDVANKVGVSPEHLSRIFVKRAKMSFSEYVRYLRVCESIGVLVKGGTVTQAAFESGFGDIRTYNRAFKSVIGMSPTQYRKSGFDNSIYY